LTSKLLRRLHCAICLSALIGCSLTLPAAEETAGIPDKPAKLFSSNDTLVVTLTAPWRHMMRNKDRQDPYPATLEYRDELGQAATLSLTIERRGITRQRICRFPPLKLRFDKQNVEGTMFRGQKSLKLVTHCESKTSYQAYYILEYLAYRIYNLITDMSFRVRPLEITYIDPESRFIAESQFAFLIEDDSDVADRFDLKKLRIPRVRLSQLDSNTTSEFALFEYMIGNVDWAALRGPDPEECCHNVKLIGPESLAADATIYPVPYDFDSSGLVDARYARPPEGLPIRDVKQRLYRGYCVHNDTMEAARQHFLRQEQAIYDLVASESRLDARSRKDAQNYLGRFFSTIRDDAEFRHEVTGRCRK
jgi:hypothetical protein